MELSISIHILIHFKLKQLKQKRLIFFIMCQSALGKQIVIDEIIKQYYPVGTS